MAYLFYIIKCIHDNDDTDWLIDLSSLLSIYYTSNIFWDYLVFPFKDSYE
jgi:hypothetical protein